ncbi:SusC/RagA family TonB-linked outer membrane protein [Pedobacter frigidisoli]|uniref:SusC/RagA family TonB-linked outer membrane protein n=1 Tax=Pedobacter frigidisoli TaxID=2530455 RepID=UPI00292ED229|nr:SusC/RagA family TonB-linked outer membrane protein [Pedobacter frigidisoli]
MTNHYFRFVRTGRSNLLNWSALGCLLLFFSLNVKAQNNQYKFFQASLNTVIAQISQKTSYEFVYDAALVKKAKPITITLTTPDIRILMDAVTKGQDFAYEISNGRTIVLKAISEKQGEYTLHGMVTDSLGGPLPGASVKLKGTTRYTMTDGNGHFNINLTNEFNTLDVNYIGYLAQLQKIDINDAQNVVTIKLKSNASLLSDVIVNGYQSLPASRGAGAAITIDNKKLNENINVDILSALEGRVAGLVYNKNPNGIGADRPVLRGQATFSFADVTRNPLVVIDGLPSEMALEDINPYDIESVTVLKDGAAASIYGSRSANGVIVLTTKKGNSPLKISLNTDFFIDTKPTFGSMHYASTADIVDFETDVYNRERARYANTETMFAAYGTVANGSIKYYSPLYQLFRDKDANKITTDQFNQQLTNFKNADYYEQYRDNVWQNAFRQRYNLSLSSASSKSNTFASVNYDRSAERVIGNNNQKLTLYFKNTYNIKKWLTSTIGFNGSYSTNRSTDSDYNNYLTISPRYASIVNADGSLVYAKYVNLSDGFAGSPINGAVAGTLQNTPQYKSYRFNILESLNEGISNANTVSLRAFADINAKIMEGLNFSSQVQYEMGTTKTEQIYDVNSYKMRAAYNALVGYTPSTNVYTFGLPTGGRISQGMQQRNSYTFRNQLSYDKSFGDKHSIAAIAGTEMRQTFLPIGMSDIRYGFDPVTLTSTIINNQSVSQTGLPSYIFGGNRTLGVAGRSFQETKHRYLSYYSNASYTYSNRYTATGSFRVDQADFFGADPEFKNRPLWSIGLGWNASNEKFIQSLGWVNMLKIRATYGINGNQNTDATKFLTARRVNDNLFTSLQYLNIVGLPNPKLRWEKTATYNVGLDLAVLNNRLRGTIDLYNRNSTDLMVTTDLDPTVGTASLLINNGVLKNKGIEFTVNGDWLKSGNLSLSSTFVIGFNRSKIGKVNRTFATASNYISSPETYYTEGSDYNTLYAYRYGGMINGYPYFLDENGKANLEFDASGNPLVSTSKDINNYAALVNMGTLIPTYNGSFSQRISYKNFDLNALFVFSGGNVMRKDVTPLGSNDISDLDITQRYKNGVTPELPRLYVDYAETMLNRASNISTMWQKADVNVVKADYVKLRSISLGYNLPKQVLKRLNIPSAKFTAQVNNLWYASAAGDDIDPESYSLNSGTRTLQNPKSFVMGINLTF